MSTPTVKELSEKIDGHIEDCAEKHARQDEMYEKNMIAIEKLTTSTQGVVDAWIFANAFRSFIQWLSGFAGLAAIAAWLLYKR